MKLRRVLYWLFISYLCINTIYISVPFIMAFASIPTTVPFYSPVITSLITYWLIKMTYLHMAVDLIMIIAVTRSCMKQNIGTRSFVFASVVTAVNLFSNLAWTFWGYVFSVQ